MSADLAAAQLDEVKNKEEFARKGWIPANDPVETITSKPAKKYFLRDLRGLRGFIFNVFKDSSQSGSK